MLVAVFQCVARRPKDYFMYAELNWTRTIKFSHLQPVSNLTPEAEKIGVD